MLLTLHGDSSSMEILQAWRLESILSFLLFYSCFFAFFFLFSFFTLNICNQELNYQNNNLIQVMPTRKNMILQVNCYLAFLGRLGVRFQLIRTNIVLDSVNLSPFAPTGSFSTEIYFHLQTSIMKIHAQMYGCQDFTSSVVECATRV